MNKALIFLAFFALSACATGSTQTPGDASDLPAMRTFKEARPTPPSRSNASIARDILDLSFRLENGGSLPVFSRFETPVTVALASRAPATFERDLDRLISRLRSEARLDISRGEDPRNANIIIQFVPREQIRAIAPSAACFVRPNVSSWEDFRQRRNDSATLWTRLTQRTRMAMFLPRDVAPQEARDCLHEELAQSLGPTNDLYRLTDSVFNDDNFHGVLTGFDMLVLRTLYDPALETGMSRADVAARLPAILARINPRGGRGGIAPPVRNPDKWAADIQEATIPRASRDRRLRLAERAVNRARSEGAAPSRLALSYYWLGRLSRGANPNQAVAAFLNARQLYRQAPGATIQSARVALQLALFQLSAGEADQAIALVDESLTAARRAEDAALLSLLLMVKAEALTLKDRTRDADRVQNEALGWARYGFGSDRAVRERAGEIAAISPRAAGNRGAV